MGDAEGLGPERWGGKVIFVLNTNKSGAGSLGPWEEPRIFRWGARIVLNQKSLVIRNPFLTIAGETAPPAAVSPLETGAEQARPSIGIRRTI